MMGKRTDLWCLIAHAAFRQSANVTSGGGPDGWVLASWLGTHVPLSVFDVHLLEHFVEKMQASRRKVAFR